MTERRPITIEEWLIIKQMAGVTFPAGSWDKRFYRFMYSATTISEKESKQLWRIFAKYRRQMRFPEKEKLLEMAKTLAAPTFKRRTHADIERETALQKYNEAMKKKDAK